MAKRIRNYHRAIFFDTEKHIEGDICWCEPVYDEATNFILHPLKFEKEKNVSTMDREHKA